MINGGLGKHTLKLSRTHLDTRAHPLPSTFSLALLILSYVLSVSDLISRSVTLCPYVSPQLMDSATSESYIMYCIVKNITHSGSRYTISPSAGASGQHVYVDEQPQLLDLIRNTQEPLAPPVF